MTGEEIRDRRHELRLSQQQVAIIAGVSRERISQLENGEEVSMKARNLYGLAKALQLAPSALAGTDLEEIALDDLITIDDPEIRLFFSGDWDTLNEGEKDWIRAAIRIAKERKRRYGRGPNSAGDEEVPGPESRESG